MSKVNCIDVSFCQVGVNYGKVKSSGIGSVIIRAGYGNVSSQKDSQFETHYKNAKAAGLNVGAYWYSYANSVDDAKREAQACLTVVKGKKFNMPIFYDLEDSSQVKFSKSTLTNMAKAFCNAIKKGGYRAGVYANLNWFNNYLDYAELKKLYPIWLAQYYTTNGKPCDVWQNSSSGRINGVNGNVDTDIIFNDDIIEKGKICDSQGYKKGQTSDGILAIKELLLIAKSKKIITQGCDENGIFGNGTEWAVNQVLKKGGYVQNGIAGDNFIKYLTKLIREKI
jgi:GH25 family lysozyme M1 (1,4-beta-N-acetylmuramidase)